MCKHTNSQNNNLEQNNQHTWSQYKNPRQLLKTSFNSHLKTKYLCIDWLVRQDPQPDFYRENQRIIEK